MKSMGSGSRQAEDIFKRGIMKYQSSITKDNLIDLMFDCILLTSLFDHPTGGHLQMAELKEGHHVRICNIKPTHVIGHLARRFEGLSVLFKRSLIQDTRISGAF